MPEYELELSTAAMVHTMQGNCKLKGESNALNKTKKRNGHFST